MRPFEYARPETEAEAVSLLNDHSADTAVLAGGDDLLDLLKRDLAAPKRVVDIKQVESLRGVTVDESGVTIGALTTLEELLESDAAAPYLSVTHVAENTHAIQMQQRGTVGGDLCHWPNCWYFRTGDGLLALQEGRSLAAEGDNRYHAIFGNDGPAKFVSASRFAPAMIAWNAMVRVIGPDPEQEEWVPLEYFYVTPKTDRQGITVLQPGQLMTHIRLEPADAKRSATYEVMEMQGLDWPLAAASATLDLEGGRVRDARIVMGHVAPTPWIAKEAEQVLVGRQIDEESASLAGDAAVAAATPLSQNEYKVQLARTAVKRALLRAVDQLEGGL